jgi:hypothetical protein
MLLILKHRVMLRRVIIERRADLANGCIRVAIKYLATLPVRKTVCFGYRELDAKAH